MDEKEMSEYDLYMYVIDDVISKVHNTFLEDGKDETVLQDLKELWQDKLIKSKAVDKNRYPSFSGKPVSQSSHGFAKFKTTAPPLPATVSTISPLMNIRIPRPQQMPTRPITCTHLLAQKNIVPTNNALRQKGAEQMIVVRNPATTTLTGFQVQQAMGQGVILAAQPGLLPQVVAGNQTPIMNVQHLRAQVATPVQIISQGLRQAQPQQIILPTQRIIQLQQPLQRLQTTTLPTTNLSINSLLNYRFKSPVNSQIVLTTNQVRPQVAQLQTTNNIIRVNNVPANQITVQRLPVNGNNLVNPRLVLPQTQRLRQVDGPSLTEYMEDFEDDEDEFLSNSSELSESDAEVKAEEEEEEPEISLDDVNPPSMSDIEDMMDCDNLLVCLFQNVTKKKTKFKLVLKLGILSVGGRESVFGQASGNLESIAP